MLDFLSAPSRALSLMASRNGAMMQTFAVTVPPGIGAGQQFQASLDGQLTMVIVPHGSTAGSTLHVQIPVRPSSVQKYAVTIPANVRPGDRFQANLGGQLVWLRCPPQLGPGKQMLVDANSATQDNGRNAKSWPPPIAVPESIDGAPKHAPTTTPLHRLGSGGSARPTHCPRVLFLCRRHSGRSGARIRHHSLIPPSPLPHRSLTAPVHAPLPPPLLAQMKMCPNTSSARSPDASCVSPR